MARRSLRAPLAKGKSLRLRAEDVDDLAVISACLQDAVVRLEDMSYMPGQHCFAAIFNRFRWEREDEPAPARGERIRCGVHFEGVLAAQTLNLAQDNRKQVLDLLAITADPVEDGGAIVHLVFAGGATVRLEAECIECQLSDLGEAWETRSRPSHAINEDE